MSIYRSELKHNQISFSTNFLSKLEYGFAGMWSLALQCCGNVTVQFFRSIWKLVSMNSEMHISTFSGLFWGQACTVNVFTVLLYVHIQTLYDHITINFVFLILYRLSKCHNRECYSWVTRLEFWSSNQGLHYSSSTEVFLSYIITLPHSTDNH